VIFFRHCRVLPAVTHLRWPLPDMRSYSKYYYGRLVNSGTLENHFVRDVQCAIAILSFTMPNVRWLTMHGVPVVQWEEMSNVRCLKMYRVHVDESEESYYDRIVREKVNNAVNAIMKHPKVWPKSYYRRHIPEHLDYFQRLEMNKKNAPIHSYAKNLLQRGSF